MPSPPVPSDLRALFRALIIDKLISLHTSKFYWPFGFVYRCFQSMLAWK